MQIKFTENGFSKPNGLKSFGRETTKSIFFPGHGKSLFLSERPSERLHKSWIYTIFKKGCNYCTTGSFAKCSLRSTSQNFRARYPCSYIIQKMIRKLSQQDVTGESPNKSYGFYCFIKSVKDNVTCRIDR